MTLPFGEVVPALERGDVDCAVTGTLSLYTAGWHTAVTHAYTLRLGWGLAFGAMNMDRWNSLSGEQRRLLRRELGHLTDEMWAETATEDDIAIACLTGGPCPLGEPAHLVLVEPGERDEAGRRRIAEGHVLARWAERCGPACVAQWNDTVGRVLGLVAR